MEHNIKNSTQILKKLIAETGINFKDTSWHNDACDSAEWDLKDEINTSYKVWFPNHYEGLKSFCISFYTDLLEVEEYIEIEGQQDYNLKTVIEYIINLKTAMS